MKKLFYPAIFQSEENNAFTVFFPDIPECITCGENMDDAYEMAIDCLGLVLSHKEANKEPIPSSSSPSDIKLEVGQFVVAIEFDMLAYQKKHNGKAVKKTLSIPEWMNEEATSKGINFSQVLQEALVAKLQMY